MFELSNFGILWTDISLQNISNNVKEVCVSLKWANLKFHVLNIIMAVTVYWVDHALEVFVAYSLVL